MTWRCGLVLGLLVIAASGCGGKTDDGSNASGGGAGGTSATGGGAGTAAMGGSAGTGGSSAMGGTSGTGATGGAGGSPTSCDPGGPCNPEGDSCTPPGCCQCTYVCKGGTWVPGACPSCAPVACPQTLPNDGDPCNECSDPVGVACTYAMCGPEATCDGQHWHIVISTCPPATPCDPSTGACPAGELCVHPGGLGAQPLCEPNPCMSSEPVSCACAGSLCPYGYCASATANAVYCDCPNC